MGGAGQVLAEPPKARPTAEDVPHGYDPVYQLVCPLPAAEEGGGMSYYKTCPRCGAHLDPGETCDCVRKELKAAIMSTSEDDAAEVPRMVKEEKAV